MKNASVCPYIVVLVQHPSLNQGATDVSVNINSPFCAQAFPARGIASPSAGIILCDGMESLTPSLALPAGHPQRPWPLNTVSRITQTGRSR